MGTAVAIVLGLVGIYLSFVVHELVHAGTALAAGGQVTNFQLFPSTLQNRPSRAMHGPSIVGFVSALIPRPRPWYAATPLRREAIAYGLQLLWLWAYLRIWSETMRS